MKEALGLLGIVLMIIGVFLSVKTNISISENNHKIEIQKLDSIKTILLKDSVIKECVKCGQKNTIYIYR